MKRLKRSLLNCRIAIKATSDFERNLYTRLQYGDYWVKYELIKVFGEMGCIVTDEYPNIVIHLFGRQTKLPKTTYNLIWIYSHPDEVTPKLLRQYDKIFCLSSSFINKINQMGFEAKLMLGATVKKPIVSDIKYDIVFVGNARPELPYGRKIIQDVGETAYNFKVWGYGWKNILPKKYYGGAYFDNQRLNELYASSLITLNDHFEDMANEGFVAVRIFDILASGGFCISDKNSGIKEIFGDTVPQYKSAEHLRKLIDFYINNPDERLELMKKGQKIALSHPWQERAKQFLGDLINTKNE
ncbi:glycosyltransferase [candidate division WOR-3 bacterium]|nr:glycosyltransferase [candidate division WOR-3 bacterium]